MKKLEMSKSNTAKFQEYGYELETETLDLFFEEDEDEYESEDDDKTELDEDELTSFLNEYFLVNPNRLPESTIF